MTCSIILYWQILLYYYKREPLSQKTEALFFMTTTVFVILLILFAVLSAASGFFRSKWALGLIILITVLYQVTVIVDIVSQGNILSIAREYIDLRAIIINTIINESLYSLIYVLIFLVMFIIGRKVDEKFFTK